MESYFMGRLGNGLRFKRSSLQYSNLSSNAAYDFNAASSMSISAWVVVGSASNDYTLIGTRNSAPSFLGWSLDFNKSATPGEYYVQFTKGLGGAESFLVCRSTTNFKAGILTHIVVTALDHSANNVTMAINGMQGGYSILYNTLKASDTWPALRPINVGTFSDNNSLFLFDGYVMDVKLFPRVLTAQEIAILYAKENQKWLNEALHVDFNKTNGKVLYNRVSGLAFSLTNYTDAETASNGQPQANQTAWVNAYSLLPITS